MGGSFGVVAHAFADDGEGDALALGDAGPGVAGHVEGERNLQSGQPCDFLQLTVRAGDGVPVLVPVVGVGEDGQQIGIGGRGGVFVDEVLHACFPFDAQLLAGFVPAVDENVVLQIFLAQVGHVDERHAAGVERKEEDVAGEVQGGLPCQV